MKTILSTLLILATSLSYCQVIKPTKQDSIQMKQFTDHCNDMFEKEMRTGVVIQCVGLAVYGVSRIKAINGEKEAQDKMNVIVQRESDVYNETHKPYTDVTRRREYEVLKDKADKFKKTGLIGALSLAAVGLGFEIHSINWLSKAYVGENGVGFKFKLGN